jgi:hypothetical protein
MSEIRKITVMSYELRDIAKSRIPLMVLNPQSAIRNSQHKARLCA